MAALDTDREFSEKKHRSGDWQTSPVGNTGTVADLFRRVVSFKIAELHRFTRQCHDGDIVVDFGCGTGVYSRYCTLHAPVAVLAVDWSFSALRTAKMQGGTSVMPVCADLQALPFKTGCADALFSIDALGHLRNQERALDEMARVCRGGAPLFLHAECADYRRRWPDRAMIGKTGSDRIAEIDGHTGIRMSVAMLEMYRPRFTVHRMYSPAGITGWLTGYPEKYAKALRAAGMTGPAAVASMAAFMKKLPGSGWGMRIINSLINRLELLLHLGGGGSCFMRGENPYPHAGHSDLSIDVVVATFNRPGILFEEINGLLRQCRGNDRIIVLWQGKDAPPVPQSRRVRLIHQKKPSLTEARNRGIRAGGNPVVVFVDDDCLIGEGLLDAYRSSFSGKTVGGVAGFVDDPLFPEVRGSEPSRFNVRSGDIRQQFNCGRDGETVSVMGANMAFTREALEKVGGFDRKYRRNAVWEDIDMSFRLLNAGFVLRYCVGADVRHLRWADGGCRQERGNAYLFHFFSNTAYFACTWAPLRYAGGWLRFWFYHLEYLTRKKESFSRVRLFRYRISAVIAGVAGAVWGGCRFAVGGCRRQMPAKVIEKSNEHFGGGG